MARAGVATLVCAVTLTACSSNDTQAVTSPTAPPSTAVAKWLTDTPLDPSKMFVDGIDTKGLMKLSAEAPQGYEAGKAFGECTVVYHAFNAGDGNLYEVVVKPNDGSNKGHRKPGLAGNMVDAWIAQYSGECNA